MDLTYETMKHLCEEDGYTVEEAPLQAHDGLISGKTILIRCDIETNKEKAQTLAEEYAHGLINAGDITDQSVMANRKQEKKARRLSHKMMKVDLDGILKCHRAGCRNAYEMAELLGCTEAFLREALENMKERYGTHVGYKGYTIFLDPHLAVMKRITVFSEVVK